MNQFDPLCAVDSGGEGSIACTLKTLALMAMAAPLGALAGVLIASLMNRQSHD
jgi:hypothetical protein